MNVAPSTAYEAILHHGTTGLAGTIRVRTIDNDGAITQAASAAGITEVATGVYSAERTSPGTAGQYTLVWDDGTDAGVLAVEDLLVAYSLTTPGVPPDPAAGPTIGPCADWVDPDEVADCCGITPSSENAAALASAATAASQVLYEASGRQFTGACERTVRPCATHGCGFQILSRGHIVGGWDRDRWAGSQCGCSPLSRVKLPGHPVAEITEVLIDGATIDPSEYRLDERRFLTRMADTDGDAQAWPACQRLDLEPTEEGTFQITYTSGVLPPEIGALAARDFACELYRACATDSGECQLPRGVTRIVRQGVTIEKVSSLAEMIRKGATGLPTVDAFIGAYNPHGIRRRATIASPDAGRYARHEGT